MNDSLTPEEQLSKLIYHIPKMQSLRDAFVKGFRANPVNKDLYEALEELLQQTEPMHNGLRFTREKGLKALAAAAKQLKDIGTTGGGKPLTK